MSRVSEERSSSIGKSEMLKLCKEAEKVCMQALIEKYGKDAVRKIKGEGIHLRGEDGARIEVLVCWRANEED